MQRKLEIKQVYDLSATPFFPLRRPYGAEGNTTDVDFDTGKDTFLTDPGCCPVTHVVLASGWEQKVAQVIEPLPQVAAYVKNDHLGLVIPYTLDREQRSYLPDFLVRARVAEGDNPLTLIVEVSRATRRDQTEKVRTARDLWMPTVSAHGGFGRWRFVEATNGVITCGDLDRDDPAAGGPNPPLSSASPSEPGRGWVPAKKASPGINSGGRGAASTPGAPARRRPRIASSRLRVA